MTDYTPTTEHIRYRYWAYGSPIPEFLQETAEHVEGAAFDRWLAEVERQVAARAWEECLRADVCAKCGDCHNPYDVEDRCSLESSRSRALDEVARISRDALLYEDDDF